MKHFFFIVFVLVFSVGNVQALDIESYDVEYDILASGEVKETLEIVFATPLNQSIQNSLTLGDIADIGVLADGSPLEVEVTPVGNDVIVAFTTPAGTKKLIISFTAKSLVFQSGEVFQFFTELTTPEVEKLRIKAILPRGFVVFRNIYFPSEAEIGADGERIFFSWTFQDSEGSVPISIQFESVVKSNQLLLPGVVVLAIVVVAGVFLYFRRKTKRAFLMTFFEDERKVILALQQEKVSYQNTLERRFEFSRAKMTRIVQKLQKKGLVKKEKAGRTNRLHWKG